MKTTYKRTMMIEDLTKVVVEIHIFENCKYTTKRAELGEEIVVRYTDVKSYSVIEGGKEAEAIESAVDASGVDELGARVNVANRSNSDALVSVHINAFNNPSVGGIATYYYSKTGNDARLAQKVQSQIANTPGFNGDRGIQEGNLYVLRHSNMPAILVELGFISNPNEERVLQSPQTQEDFANRIANGIANYFGG